MAALWQERKRGKMVPEQRKKEWGSFKNILVQKRRKAKAIYFGQKNEGKTSVYGNFRFVFLWAIKKISKISLSWLRVFLAAIRFVHSLRIAVEGSHGAALLEKLVKISILGFANRSLAPYQVRGIVRNRKEQKSGNQLQPDICLAAIRSVRSLRIAFRARTAPPYWKKLVRISILGFAKRTLAP